MHAKFCGHSELTIHSGRQTGGLPIKFGLQEQTAKPFNSLQFEFGPHGDGEHGFIGITSAN